MKVKDYILKLQKIEKKHGNLVLCYSKDDEGNEYQEVNFSPTTCRYEDNKIYIDIPEGSITHICIN